MRHHAFIIEAEAEEGIRTAQAWAERELSLSAKGNPDVIVRRHGLLSVEDVRGIVDSAAQAPFCGDKKIIIITASRAYHEAQNALLKLFEEPPPGMYLFLILPSFGGLLPTLRSRVAILDISRSSASGISEEAERFIQASREKRTAMIKKLASGKDEDERRAHRDEAIRIVNGIEAVAYGMLAHGENAAVTALLLDIAVLRGNLYDRSAPLRMILEHVSLVLPKRFSIAK